MTTPTDILRNSVFNILSDVHTCMPGIVKSFDASTNKATIQPALNKAFTTGEMPMPILENVPMMFPGSGDFRFTFPIREGDYCLLLFSERSIDLWLSVGGQVTPNDRRKFDLSDAIAIPGLLPFNSSFPNNGTDFTLSFNGSYITIKENGEVVINTSSTVAIGNTTTELLDVLSQTLAFLSSATAVPLIPSGGSPPQPLTFAAAAATLKTQLDAIKGTIP